MEIHRFTAIFERMPEGGYLVSVPVLPGCHTEGRTLEEAKEMAIDAIQGYCQSLIEHGEAIPGERFGEQFIGYLEVPMEVSV